jgi:glycosyltransferase involved in cell wall biosynthesis
MGLHNLIAAMTYCIRAVPDSVLMIAGVGPARSSLEKQIAELGLTDSVILLGYVPDRDLPLAYRAADLVVVPSLALEGFGLTAVESLATGTPVVVTPVGGLPEVVNDLDQGLVFEGNEPKHIASGIINSLLNPSALPSNERCTEFARRKYDWPIIAKQVLQVYEEVV